MDALHREPDMPERKKKREQQFVNLLDFSELEREKSRPTTDSEPSPFEKIGEEVRQFEIRFGSRYLQIIGVLVISVAFSILGYYPTSNIPIWGQVAFMFLGAGVLLLAGEVLIEKKSFEFYALGLIFAGIKLIYSSFWSLFYNFDLIDEATFTITIVLTLGFHYYTSHRYHSAVLNASFVFLSWIPLVLLHDLNVTDNLIILLFLGILVVDLVQAHLRKETTAIMVVPASAAIYLYLNASERTIFDFTFSVNPSDQLVFLVIILFIPLTLLFIHLNYRETTLLSDFLHDFPGTTFSHLTSIFLILALIVSSPYLPPSASLFLVSLAFSGLIIVHFNARGEDLFTVSSPLITALVMSLAPSTIFSYPDSTAIILAFGFCFISEIILTKLWRLPESNKLQKQVILGFPIVLLILTVFVFLRAQNLTEFLPAVMLLLALGFQLFLSYSYIQNIHILSGEIIFLILAGGYGFYSGDELGYAIVWTGLLIFFSIISVIKKDGNLGAQLIMIMGVDLLFTAHFCGEFILLPSFLLIPALYLMARCYTGRYFIHKLLIRVNDITILLKRHRVLDLFNVTILLALMISIRAVVITENAWPSYPFIALLFSFLSFEQKRGKLVLPILLLGGALFLIYLHSLLLLVILTMFTVISVLLLFQSRNPRIDHYLQMILFVSLGVSAAVPGLEGAWLSDVLGLSEFTRIAAIYGLYAFALCLFLILSKHYSSLLFCGLVALGELSALMVFTFEYDGSIQLYFSILFVIMGYFGLYLAGHTSPIRERAWKRDRKLILAVTTVLFIFPLIVFNFRNDIPEYEIWIWGLFGVVILLYNDVIRNGLQLERWDWTTASFLPWITPGELIALLSPTLLCLNYSHDYSLWMFLSIHALMFTFVLLRESQHRIQLLLLYGLLFFAPFNIFLYIGNISDLTMHRISDLVPLTLVVLYIVTHLPPGLRDHPLLNRFFPRDPEYEWLISLGFLLLATFTSSNFGVFLVPAVIFLFTFWKRDVITSPASYVMIMGVFYLYYDFLEGKDELAHNGLLLFSILPIYTALFNDSIFRIKSLTFSFSTLSFMLMFGVPWFAAGGGSYEPTLITNIIWSVFGATSYSAGFYLDRRYLRYYGTFFLLAGIVITVYNTYILGVGVVVVSLLVFGIMALLASFFYHLKGGRGVEEAGSRTRRW